MKGGIYAADGQKCPLCGAAFLDDGRWGLSCPVHREQGPKKLQVRFGNICRRFTSYDKAQRFLTGLRYKSDEGTFDERDYQKDMPLSFRKLAVQWLAMKKNVVKPKTFNNLNSTMNRAIAAWGDTNIKDLGYAEIEDFIFSLELSQKTRHNIKSCLHDFWWWLKKRRILKLHEMPEFPEFSFELKFRKTVDKETQHAILDEVCRISFETNPRIWIGIKWLCTYISIRPGELIQINEENIDLGNGYLNIPQSKEKKPKPVPLIGEDIDLVNGLPRGLPHMPFFRHRKGNGTAKPGSRFGKDYLYKWWKRACSNLGIECVDLYGGTRHSSAIALRKYRTPEEIKRATMHSTNKAFERYFRIEAEEVRAVYADTIPIKKNGSPQRAKVLNLQLKNGAEGRT